MKSASEPELEGRHRLIEFLSTSKASDPRILMSALLYLPLLSLVWVLIGVDRLNTLSRWTSATLITCCAFGLAIAGIAARVLWGKRYQQPATDQRARVLGAGGTSATANSLCTVLAGAAAFFFLSMQLGVAAQYVGGRTELETGRTVAVLQNFSPHNPCHARLRAVLDRTHQPISVCLRTGWARGIGSGDLREGDRFEATVRRTVFGSVVTSVHPTRRPD